MANDANKLLGQNGTRELVGADGAITFDPPVVAVQAINGAIATFTTLTDVTQAGTQRLTSIGVSQIIYGKFTVIDVNAGAVRVYH